MRALACLSPKSADPSTISLGLPDFDHLGLSYPSGYDRPSHCCVAAPACVPFARLLNTSSKAPTTAAIPARLHVPALGRPARAATEPAGGHLGGRHRIGYSTVLIKEAVPRGGAVLTASAPLFAAYGRHAVPEHRRLIGNCLALLLPRRWFARRRRRACWRPRWSGRARPPSCIC